MCILKAWELARPTLPSLSSRAPATYPPTPPRLHASPWQLAACIAQLYLESTGKHLKVQQPV